MCLGICLVTAIGSSFDGTGHGTEIYSGDGSTASNFAVTLPEDGEYTVFVKAKHAKGKIYIAPISA